MAEDKKLTLSYHVPSPEVLAALGDISIRHGHLDHVLKMMIRTFTGVSVQEAMDATDREGSASLRECIRKLARAKLGEGEALTKLRALLTRCHYISERRNELIHVLCGVDEDGNAVAATREVTVWKSMPTVVDLNSLSADMQALIEDLRRARSMRGFISVALLDKTGVVGK